MITEEIAASSDALSLLSNMFLCKPTREALVNWRAALNHEISPLLHELKKTVYEIDMSSDAELEALVWEYTRLFIGPYKLPCPPWESVYTSPQRLMMQDAAAQVQSLYAEAGLAINTDDVMPDHIGVELNFLALVLRGMHEQGSGHSCFAEVGKQILRDHILRWVPGFTRDMEESAEIPFYKALARTTRSAITTLGA